MNRPIITQSGEAKPVSQDLASYHQEQETLALLKMLALGQQEVDERRARPAASAIKSLRVRIASRSAAKD